MELNELMKATAGQLWNGPIDKDGNRYIGWGQVQTGPDGKMLASSGRYPVPKKDRAMSYDPNISPAELQEALRRIRVEKGCLDELGVIKAYTTGRKYAIRLVKGDWVEVDAETGEVLSSVTAHYRDSDSPF